MRLPPSIAAWKRRVKEMALLIEWLPEEWPDGVPSVKQLLVVALLLIPMLLLFASELTLLNYTSAPDEVSRASAPPDFAHLTGGVFGGFGNPCHPRCDLEWRGANERTCWRLFLPLARWLRRASGVES